MRDFSIRCNQQFWRLRHLRILVSTDEKASSNGSCAKDMGELIVLTVINRVKSEQAIRRSKALVKGTECLIGRPMHATAPPSNAAKDPSRTMEVVRQEARKLRERSRQAIEESKAARGRIERNGNGEAAGHKLESTVTEAESKSVAR